MSIMNRGRVLSPDRGSLRRSNKRQKQNHERPVTYPGTTPLLQVAQQDVDLGVFGVEQAMAGVEFMLKEAVEKVRYGRDEEIEKYVLLLSIATF